MHYLTWPNAVTAMRFPLAAAFIAVDGLLARGLILAAAASSDWLDGWLARRLGQHSSAGQLLDPVADKTFVLAALASFVVAGSLQVWQLIVLLARDLYAVLGFFVAALLRWPLGFEARRSGKIVTVFQILTVFVLLLQPAWIGVLVAAVGMVSAYAIIDYTRAGLDDLRGARSRR
jgi:CDP-diacylglycerol--glycerol-3-phosphate 3-phosphatidyltransferase